MFEKVFDVVEKNAEQCGRLQAKLNCCVAIVETYDKKTAVEKIKKMLYEESKIRGEV